MFKIIIQSHKLKSAFIFYRKNKDLSVGLLRTVDRTNGNFQTYKESKMLQDYIIFRIKNYYVVC